MSVAAMSNLTEVEQQAKKLLKTAPFDSRFPNQNQTRYCNQNYIDYHRCRKIKGEDYEPCEYFKRLYKSMCLNSWISKWDDQIENGTFPVKI